MKGEAVMKEFEVENYYDEDLKGHINSAEYEREINRLKGSIKRGVMVYGRLPLMVTANCPVNNEINCAKCRLQTNAY